MKLLEKIRAKLSVHHRINKKNGAVNTNSAIYDIKKTEEKILQEINQNEPVSRGLDSQETMKK